MNKRKKIWRKSLLIKIANAYRNQYRLFEELPHFEISLTGNKKGVFVTPEKFYKFFPDASSDEEVEFPEATFQNVRFYTANPKQFTFNENFEALTKQSESCDE